MRFACIDGEERHRPLVLDRFLPEIERAGHSLSWFEEPTADASRYAALAKGHDGLLVFANHGPVANSVFEDNPTVRVLSYAGTGVHKFIDVDAASRAGVVVYNVAGYAANSVAEHTIASIFAVARRVGEGDRLVREGRWDGRQVGADLAGKTVGLVGMGSIARAVLTRARALGLNVIAWTGNPTPSRAAALGIEFVSLETLFDESDIVSLHLAHTVETEGLVSAELLERLKPSAIFVNSARAEIVDTQHLYSMLRQRRLFGAALDVFDTEPASPQSLPLEADNVIFTPHQASFSPDALEGAYRLAVHNLLDFAAGDWGNAVNASQIEGKEQL